MNIIVIGCDGYIGNAITQRLLVKGHKVIGVDNFLRRKWVEEMSSFSAIPIKNMDDKIILLNKIGEFYFAQIDVVKDYASIESFIELQKPDVVINLGHIPSGPYSHISREHANAVLENNVIGTNNLLWAIRTHSPDTHYITIGTTGEYDHYSNIDIEEGYFNIVHNGRESKELMYPRRPGSIYHCSKTASTYLIDFLARTWGLKCTDVQQSIVFGAYTEEIEQTKIFSRFDSDEAGGTIVNRFIVQAMLDMPLTIYGEGEHQRGFLSLNDSVQALEIAVNNPAKSGHVQVWNQLSEWYWMNEIANMVMEACDYPVEAQHIPSPRTECTKSHYYKYCTDKLQRLGYVPSRTVEQEVRYANNMLKPIKESLVGLKDVVLPRITWK